MSEPAWREVEALFAAAMELLEADQAAYLASAAGGRPDLQAEVESLLRAHAEAGRFLCVPGTMGESWIGRRIGPYRICEEVGQGGMGAVFLARREDQFQKRVAIKIIRGIVDPELLSRFLEERQILATLEHPNIARLLDGGASQEGAPYMVMEFVEGIPITEYAKRHNLRLRARLQMFQTVCLAVHYAHQRLVVHRDIKPANILVTDAGAPVLLDFGIAKMLNPLTSASASTQSLWRPATPDYASPEHLRGEPVTTVSDVYSLGVLLYELLTGTRPYSLAGTPLLESIRIDGGAELPAPSTQIATGADEFSGDLDRIAMKAMRKEPEERYASAQALSEDVERYLDGLPVLAQRRSAGYVVRKLIRRHRIAFASACAALLLAVAGISAILREVHIANLERAKALKRFNELHSLAHSVIFELHDGIARLAGSTEVRKTLVTRGLAYLDSLASDSVNDSGLQLELAAAYGRIGDIQGNMGGPNLGDSKGALASYSKGLGLAEAARRSASSMHDRDAAAARLHLRMSEVYLRTGDVQQAQAHAAQGLALVRARPPGHDLAAALLDMYLAKQITDRAAARPYLEEAGQQYESLLPHQPDLAHDAAVAHRYLATYGDDLKQLNRSLVLDQGRWKEDPADTGAKHDVSLDLMEIGLRYLYYKQPAMALQYYRRGLSIRQELALADPKNVLARARLAFAYLSVARALSAMGDHSGVLDNAGKSAKIYADMTTAEPDDHGSWLFLADADRMLGTASFKLARIPESCQAFRRSADAFRLGTPVRTDIWILQTKAEIDAGLSRCPR